MHEQVEALQLADALDRDATNGDMGRKPDKKCHKRRAATELRRQHQEITELKKVKEALLEENSTLRKCATECLKFAANMKNKDMSQ